MRFLIILVTLGLILGPWGPSVSAAVDPSLVPPECGAGTYDRLIVMTSPGTVNGTALRDIIIGTAGNDTISGGAGNDCILGGDGDDTLRGGAGNDRLFGQGADDFAHGDSGVDLCEAEAEQSCEF